VSMKKDGYITCIICPRGCAMKVQNRDEGYIVSGNKCGRGTTYGIGEFENPVRSITTTVRVIGGTKPVVPVKTDKPVPKGLIFDIMNIINEKKLCAPVIFGEIVIRDILGTGANIISTGETSKHTGGL